MSSKFILGHWEYYFDLMLAKHDTWNEIRRLKIAIDGCLLIEDRLSENAPIFLYLNDQINRAYDQYITDRFLSD